MENIKKAHIEEFSCSPSVIVSAPGRIHLAGEHSWYFKDATLSMAVNLPVAVAISPRTDGSLHFFFPQLKDRKKCTLANLRYRKEDRWANACKAMIFGLIDSGGTCQGLNITVYSDLQPSAGFGITTAIKVATAMALCRQYIKDYTDQTILDIIDCGNNDFLGVDSYLSDIYTALFAKENSCILIDHRKETYQTIPCSFEDCSIILTDAGVPRVSLWNEDSIRTFENFILLEELKTKKGDSWVYEDSPTEINEVLSVVTEEVRRRLLCMISEYRCVCDAAEGLRNNDFQVFARALNRSHENMRDLYSISCPEIDWLVKRTLEHEGPAQIGTAACSRITGKGFGRCTYTFIKNDGLEAYEKRLADYDRIFGFKPAFYKVRSVSGAQVIQG